MLIRDGKPNDIPAIVDLWKEYIDLHSRYDPFFKRAADGHVHEAQFLARSLTDENWKILVADSDHQLAGFCSGAIMHYPPAHAAGPFGYIQDMAVSEKFRRQGIGRQLVRALENWFTTKGLNRIELNVLLKNPLAVDFWRALGYSPFTQRMIKTW